MRIGILIHSLDGGGGEAVARLWVTELARRGHHLVCLVYAAETAEVPAGAARVVTFDRTSAADRWTRLPGWVRQTVRANALDVVVSVLDFSNITLLRAFSGRPHHPALVVTEHSVMDLMWRHEGAAGQVKRLLAKGLYRHADAVIAVSHAVATDLRIGQAVPAEKLFVLPNAIAGSADSPGWAEATRPADPRLLYVGRLAPEKQPALFLDTTLELLSRNSAWRGLMIGDGPSRAELTETVSRQGLPIEFAGWVQPWQGLARAGDCLLMTSDVEGLGNVLVEAAAAGLGCVAPSSALGVADAVISGVTGVLARSSRPTDMADAVIHATALGRQPATVAAWLRNFDPVIAGGRLEVILQAVVADATLGVCTSSPR